MTIVIEDRENGETVFLERRRIANLRFKIKDYCYGQVTKQVGLIYRDVLDVTGIHREMAALLGD